MRPDVELLLNHAALTGIRETERQEREREEARIRGLGARSLQMLLAERPDLKVAEDAITSRRRTRKGDA